MLKLGEISKGIKDGTADAKKSRGIFGRKIKKIEIKKLGGSHGWELLKHIEDYIFE